MFDMTAWAFDHGVVLAIRSNLTEIIPRNLLDCFALFVLSLLHANFASLMWPSKHWYLYYQLTFRRALMNLYPKRNILNVLICNFSSPSNFDIL